MSSMREQMPTIARWIDELREVFGRESIDAAIWQGMRDGTFRARENGHSIGYVEEGKDERSSAA